MYATNISIVTSVIVLIETKTNSIILTERCKHLKDHPGEACFPGGHWHMQDLSLWHTGLRELQEELGIDKSRVQFKKALKREKTLKGKIIYPWLATIDSIEPFSIDKKEVEKVFKLLLPEVCNLKNYQEITLERNGQNFVSLKYNATTEKVWGATARIMRQLCFINLNAF